MNLHKKTSKSKAVNYHQSFLHDKAFLLIPIENPGSVLISLNITTSHEEVSSNTASRYLQQDFIQIKRDRSCFYMSE